MEMEDRPLYSADTVCDENINEDMVRQPDMPTVPFFKRLWYAFGRVEALYQINHIATARALQSPYSAEVVFEPKLKSDLMHVSEARIMARARVQKYLNTMGFETIVNTNCDVMPIPDTQVHVLLSNKKNMECMRVFGPYILFDRNHMLNPAVLNQNTKRQR